MVRSRMVRSSLYVQMNMSTSGGLVSAFSLAAASQLPWRSLTGQNDQREQGTHKRKRLNRRNTRPVTKLRFPRQVQRVRQSPDHVAKHQIIVRQSTANDAMCCGAPTHHAHKEPATEMPSQHLPCFCGKRCHGTLAVPVTFCSHQYDPACLPNGAICLVSQPVPYHNPIRLFRERVRHDREVG